MDSTHNLERSQVTETPDQYKPYISTELTDKQVEYAKDVLNETEETRNKYLRRFRRFLDGELEDFSDLEDMYCLSFLRRSRFDFKEACLLAKNGLGFIEANKEYLRKVNTDIVRQVIDSNIIGFLPYRDAKGRAIVYIKSENWNPDDLKVEDLIFGTLVALHRTVENPVNQVSGYVIIHDFKNFYFKQYTSIMTWALFLLNTMRDGAPLTIREVHLIHSPALFLMAWNVVQPFLDESLKKRISFYGSEDWDRLHEKIPPCILPEELGGYLGPFTNDHWATDIPSITKHYFDMFHNVLEE